MKRALLRTEYSFNAAARQITLIGLGNAEVERIYAIDNITREAIYYLAARPNFAPTASGVVITLNPLVSVTGHTNSDNLHILYEVAEPLPTGAATEANQATTNTALANILTELGAKVEPADLAPLATAANQATQIASAGAPTDAEATGDGSQIGILKRLRTLFGRIPPLIASLVAVRETDQAMPVAQRPTPTWRTSFASAISGGVDAAYWGFVRIGTGMTVNQTGGNLVITGGTTPNAETIIRSLPSFGGSLLLRFAHLLSNRDANNNWIVELVDVIGDALAFTINSATSVTVTFPTTNPFSAVNVGQSVNIGAITGAAGIPGRWAIASVSGLTVTFTVAGWPASGSGTCSLFGWNYYETRYTTATATAVSMNSGRRGYANTAAAPTGLTTASPGLVMAMNAISGVNAQWFNRLRASATAEQHALLASFQENLPETGANLFVQIRALNGTVAPAAQTWTVNFVSVEDTIAQPVIINAHSPSSALPVQITSLPNVTIGAALPTGANLLGALLAAISGTANGSANTSKYVSAAGNNLTSVVAAATALASIAASNNSATQMVYLKLYNKASAPVLASDVPVDIIAIPPRGSIVVPYAIYPRFSTGLAFALVGGDTGSADTDTTTVSANQVTVTFRRA
jgi:hypothetical protein